MASPSFRSIFAYAGNILSQFPLFSNGLHRPSPATHYDPLSGAPSCPLDGDMSCHNSTPVAGDSCCFVYPGGKLLLTQFWDEEVHAGGTEEDWTLHGLW